MVRIGQSAFWLLLVSVLLGPAFAQEEGEDGAPAEEAPPAEAAASRGPMDAVFENTVVITSSTGETKVWFNRDGTVLSEGPTGSTMGTWKVTDGKICTKVEGTESCGVVEPNRKVGDSWEHKVGDETVTVTIVEGR